MQSLSVNFRSRSHNGMILRQLLAEYAYIHIDLHVYMYIYIHMCTYIYVYVHAYMYMYMGIFPPSTPPSSPPSSLLEVKVNFSIVYVFLRLCEPVARKHFGHLSATLRRSQQYYSNSPFDIDILDPGHILESLRVTDFRL